ncbi:UDP-N-acetylglucosamine transferase subunit ALG14 [Kordiimonas aquimaris]|uniref:UDP-N-acetylglucosamine transferase subunit ALG14 n=1 Tax=Kordiimonas aquimaris TaxID=707591 RepID=UPI0021D0DEF7|nr:UDP-N-acetylglucosamine transferase subunit ALG14 [Kordiimonas aquimaris]
MLRLRPAFRDCDVTYVTVNLGSRSEVGDSPFYVIPDGNRDTKLSLILMAIRVLYLVLRVRPNVVVSTGAAPGYFACRFAKLVGAKSLFIDSVANAEEMSLSAKLATSHASRVFSQWPRVAEKFGVECHGSVL